MRTLAPLPSTTLSHFLPTCTWDAFSVNANRMKQLLNSSQRYLSQVYLLEQLRNCQDSTHRAKTSSCSHDMERHARKCVDRYCELANKKTEQLYKVSHPCLDDHQFKHSSRKNSNQWRIVRSLLTNCLDMLVRGTNLKTRHSVVGQQTCSISHCMDRSM